MFQKKKLINNKTIFTNQFLYICCQIKNSGEEVNISQFVNFIGSKYKIFEGGRQNDSQEFCRKLLENINSELNEVNDKSSLLDLSNSFSKPKKMRYSIFWDEARKKEKSIITDLFYSVMGKVLQCNCGKEFYVFQELLDIPLLIPENKSIVNIKELLENFFTTEYVEKFCEQCNEQKKFSQKTNIAHPPEILILSIQRITENNEKKVSMLNLIKFFI